MKVIRAPIDLSSPDDTSKLDILGFRPFTPLFVPMRFPSGHMVFFASSASRAIVFVFHPSVSRLHRTVLIVDCGALSSS